MNSLSKELRRLLENTVLKARDEAERGAAAALESLGVADAKLPGHLDEAGKVLRRKLRAHGRQVGDMRQPDDSQEVEHLIHECAYGHWHRMLFARFLAENGYLIEPESGLDVDFAHCEEEAKILGVDAWELASQFAQKMLPGIFRPDDPVLQLRLPAESRIRLMAMLGSLPREVFVADDSLGWVYQFWQQNKKEWVDKKLQAGGEVEADDLAPKTQLFTEDYMVEFLLHNTLGAWWTAKRRTEGRSQPIALSYLRLKADGTPEVSTFESWPKMVKQLRVLDPCMGSGHFLVFALVILVRMRMEEEGFSARDACVAVLRDNLFGLELDPRCTQIAAFNLALAAWKLGGYQAELPLQLACSGLGLHAKKEDWLKLAERAALTNPLAADADLLGTREETLLSQKLKAGMERLYHLFEKAPLLGSLINPRSHGGDMLMAEFHDLQPLLAKALERETGDEAHELAVTAQGVARAAEILAGQFTLVATNVPYLGRGKQNDVLKDYCERVHFEAKNELATCFVERCLDFCSPGCSTALVTPRGWLFQRNYKKLRASMLASHCFGAVARLGARAFETITGEVVNVVLLSQTRSRPSLTHGIAVWDVSSGKTPSDKKALLLNTAVSFLNQQGQLKNPDAAIGSEFDEDSTLLKQHCGSYQGLCTSDDPQFIFEFWELASVSNAWRWLQSAAEQSGIVGGCSSVLHWEDGCGRYYRHAMALKSEGRLGGWKSGGEAWGKRGVAINVTKNLFVNLYLGELFDNTIAALIPKTTAEGAAVYKFCSSPQYREQLRDIDPSLSVTEHTLLKVDFDAQHWQQVAAAESPGGLPLPFSNDARQWVFNGHPRGALQSLQVAVAQLVGYRWPRQTGSSFPDCAPLGPDGLEKHADKDGVVCFSQVRDEAPAATRLRALLADAYGAEWGHATERKLIAATGSTADSLEDWLRDDFFAQHCGLFHSRPFVWHIWDGRKDGFNVLVNYHKLAGPNTEGHRTLETLTYAYLGDWIARQRDAVAHGEAGADDRLAAALELQEELKRILIGEPPYDLFIRWKPLHEQPSGWEPDINDGVRLNIRPFMLATLSRGKKGCGLFRAKPGSSLKWEKDRGKEPSRPKEDFPWFWTWDEQTVDFTGRGEFDGNRWNNCHYTTAFKRAAREAKSKKQ